MVSLFTLTQTFPNDLKPATYPDPVTRRVVGRTEIERRQDYIQLMKSALGETHSLVKLTLDCLAFFVENRPSAVEVLRRLGEVGKTVPQNCTETKLELIQRVNDLSAQGNDDTGKFDHFRQFEKQVADQQSYIDQLLAAYDQLSLAHGQLQSERLGQQQQIARLQARVNDLEAEQKQQVEGFEELTALQQQHLEVQRKEIQQLSG